MSTNDTEFNEYHSDSSYTLILHPHLKNIRDHDEISHDPLARLEEAKGLARAIKLDVRYGEVIPLRKAHAGSLFGKGTVERIKGIIEHEKVSLVVIDSSVSPIQQRNLEKAWNCKVIDRTGLILAIFGERAKTSEGRLQVELASLMYQKSRLVRSWTHLERQRGGLGTVGGPGETQIEVDRRLIGSRISKLKVDIEAIKKTRQVQRKSRKKTPYPVVALVGYTNAGKSTLFNKLTNATVIAKDILFATLDPTMRSLKLPSGRTVIMSDTVGFISDLPTQLVAAFRATLEEVLEADLLLHVRDISHEQTATQAADVYKVLKKLGIDKELSEHIIEVHNKIDLLNPDHIVTKSDAVEVSALTGMGLNKLQTTIDEFLAQNENIVNVMVPCDNGKAIAWIHSHGEVIEHKIDDDFNYITARMSAENLDRFKKLFPDVK